MLSLLGNPDFDVRDAGRETRHGNPYCSRKASLARGFPRTRIAGDRLGTGRPIHPCRPLGGFRMSASATGLNRQSGLASRREAVRLLDVDPDLGAGLTSERRTEAGALRVQTHQLRVGAWQVARMRTPSGASLGLLMLDGVISRELSIADTVSVELLGPGDLIRPWPAPIALACSKSTSGGGCSRPPPSSSRQARRRRAGGVAEIVDRLHDRLTEDPSVSRSGGRSRS
jgi:hypothetical protein